MYSDARYRLAGTDIVLEATGELSHKGNDYVLIENEDSDFDIYLLNDDGEIIFADSEEAKKVSEVWQKETFGESWCVNDEALFDGCLVD